MGRAFWVAGSWLSVLIFASACGSTKGRRPLSEAVAGAEVGGEPSFTGGGAGVGGAGVGGVEQHAGESNGGGGAEGDAGSGTGASGGTGGEAGEGATAPTCEDANPCTVDDVVDGKCEHSPQPDGTACDDGDFCTLGDTCVRGSCAAGAESSGPVEALGRVQGFGSQGVIGTGTGRYLFYESTNDRVRVSLVELEGDAARVLDHETLPSSVSFLDTDHASVPVASLGNGLIAMGGAYSSTVVLLDVAGDGIEVRSELELPYTFEVPHARSFALQGDRLWVCATTFFSGGILYQIDLSDPSSPSVVAQHSAPACGSMAGSANGDTLYLNTPSGVYPLDMSHLDDDGTFEVGEIMAPNAGVTIAGPYLMFRESTQVRVLYEADRSEAFVIPVATRGAALIGERLFLQGERPAGAGTESFLAVYDIAGDAPELLDEATVASDPVVPAWASGASFRLAADAEHAIHYQTKRVFRLVDDELREMAIHGLGSLKYVAFDGEAALSLERSRTQAFDISDPASPTPVKSQSYFNPQLYHVAPVLYESLEPQQIHFGYGDEPVSDQTELWGSDRATGTPDIITLQRRSLDSELTERRSTLQISRSPSSNVLAEGGTLYRLVLPTRGSIVTRLQRYALDELPGDGEMVGEARDVLDLAPSVPWLTASDFPTAVFDVDARAQRAAVAISVRNESAHASVVYWLDLSASPPVVLDTQAIEPWPVGLRISGERLALALAPPGSCCVAESLAVWERGSTLVSFEGRGDIPDRSLSLIAFDGRAAYARGTYYNDQAEKVMGLAVVPWDSAANSAFVPMQAAPTSIAATSNGLVVGSTNELVTIRPYCGG